MGLRVWGVWGQNRDIQGGFYASRLGRQKVVGFGEGKDSR